MKIAIIGAGGYVFPVQVVADIVRFPALQETHFALMDIRGLELEANAAILRGFLADKDLPATVTTTLDRREAIEGANFVIVVFHPGGVDAFRADVLIPRRYGIDVAVGDTLGPGGVFRFLRAAPIYREMVDDIRELAPDALVINYTNPMAMCTWLLASLGVPVVGMCHSITDTAGEIARVVGIPTRELEYLAAGINHQAWYLELRHNGRDVYPEFRRRMFEAYVPADPTVRTRKLQYVEALRPHDGRAEDDWEFVRTELFATFGYYQSESSHHASEYVPYFRKDAETIARYIPERWDVLELTEAYDNVGHADQLLAFWRPDPVYVVERSAEVIDSLVTGTPRTIYANVPNSGLITNLPAGCVVEVPCNVGAAGVQPVVIGDLPVQCAALNRTNINVQELAVTAVLEADREQVYRAVALDPLTASRLTLPEIRALVDELFEAEAPWLERTFSATAATPAVSA